MEKLFGIEVVDVQKNVNTNNAWGFGGAIKTIYTLANGFTIHKGTAYYRHAKPEKFINLRTSEGTIVAEGKKEMESYLNKLNPEVENTSK